MAGDITKALGIEISESGPEKVVGRMPVDERTHQPFGLLHGGASVVLAETLGSVGSHLAVVDDGMRAVGIEVNATHVRGVRSGWVTGIATLEHRGRKLHVWSIRIVDDQERLVCTSRLTVMIVPAHA